MKKLFDTDYIVTRPYGFKDAYYTQYGFLGHEGCDFVPNSSQQMGANIYSPMDGVVIRDTDDISQDPDWAAYGKKVIIWNKEKKVALWFCHLQKNVLSLGQQIKEGDLIGQMGNTSIPGNNFGAHLHLNACETDDNGTRINQNNGYKGFINPLPLIEADTHGNTVSIDSEKFGELVGKATKYDAIVAGGYDSIDEINQRVNEFSSQVHEVSNERDQYKAEAKDLSDFMEQLSLLLHTPKEQAKIIAAVSNLLSEEESVSEITNKLTTCQKDSNDMQNQISELAAGNAALHEQVVLLTETNQRLEKENTVLILGKKKPFKTLTFGNYVMKIYKGGVNNGK